VVSPECFQAAGAAKFFSATPCGAADFHARRGLSSRVDIHGNKAHVVIKFLGRRESLHVRDEATAELRRRKLCAFADRSQELLIVVELAFRASDFEEAVREQEHNVVRGELTTESLVLRALEYAQSRARSSSPVEGRGC
jgi:hypothetical protein